MMYQTLISESVSRDISELLCSDCASTVILNWGEVLEMKSIKLPDDGTNMHCESCGSVQVLIKADRPSL